MNSVASYTFFDILIHYTTMFMLAVTHVLILIHYTTMVMIAVYTDWLIPLIMIPPNLMSVDTDHYDAATFKITNFFILSYLTRRDRLHVT